MRGSLPLGAEHKNLEGLKTDDHHGAGCDLTYETNKFIRIRLEARKLLNRTAGKYWKKEMEAHQSACSNKYSVIFLQPYLQDGKPPVDFSYGSINPIQ